jgi:hypothetical protein
MKMTTLEKIAMYTAMLALITFSAAFSVACFYATTH